MTWELQWGQEARHLERIAIQSGVVDETLLSRPALRSPLEVFAWDTWAMMSGFKASTGFGASPVSVTDVINVCALHSMDARDIVPLIAALETTWRVHCDRRGPGTPS